MNFSSFLDIVEETIVEAWFVNQKCYAIHALLFSKLKGNNMSHRIVIATLGVLS